MMDDQIFSGGFEEVTPYFMNKDGCMEATADAAPESAMAAGATLAWSPRAWHGLLGSDMVP